MAVANSILDLCRILASSGGTGSFTEASAVTGYQGSVAAGAVNGALYSYRAESADLTEWEYGVTTYSTTGPTFARTTILGNSAGTTLALNFTNAPQVAIVELSQDLQNASLLATGTVASARLPAGSTSAQGAVILAAKADQESASGNKVVTPGVQQSHPSAAKAWVFFDASGNILASYGISSVSKSGTGIYTINFSTAFSSTSYDITFGTFNTATGGGAVRICTITAQTTSSITIGCTNGSGTAVDPTNGYFITTFGDQ